MPKERVGVCAQETDFNNRIESFEEIQGCCIEIGVVNLKLGLRARKKVEEALASSEGLTRLEVILRLLKLIVSKELGSDASEESVRYSPEHSQ